MVFSHQFIDEVKMRVSLSDVVGKRVKLIKKGKEFLGLCPFHSEKTPSFTVNNEKGFYHCFGCQAHGSVFDFVMETERLSFRDTVEKLAALVGMEIPRHSVEDAQQYKTYEVLIKLMEAATQFFQKSLLANAGKNARDYLKSRGLNQEIVSQFRVGYAPHSQNLLKSELKNKGFSEESMLLAGVLVKSNSSPNSTYYDRFRNRIIFPIDDRRGKIIGFGARALGDIKPKYLNSPETPIYQKRKELYGFSHAAPSAHKKGHIIITEGYMDVIALHKAGFKNSVAPLGTAITDDQLQNLWKVVSEPILCFDGDSAGKRAAIRAASRALPLLRSGYTVRFSSLPSGEDPDSVIKSSGPEAMQRILSNSIPLSNFLWNLETKGGNLPDSPEERAHLHKKLQDYAYLIQDQTMRGYFLSFFKNCLKEKTKLGANFTKIKNNFTSKNWGPNIFLQKEAGPEAKIDINFIRHAILIAVLINHPKMYDFVGERLGSITCIPSALDKLRQEVLKICEDQEIIESEIIKNHLKESGQENTLAKVLSESVLGHAYFIRKETPLEEARKGWEEVFNQIKVGDLMAEIEIAEKKFADRPTSDTWNRLVALREQELSSKPPT